MPSNNKSRRPRPRQQQQQQQPHMQQPQQQKEQAMPVQQDSTIPPSPSSDADICFICAEPIKYYAVSACNHRTCHVCALRLRALYKKTDCTFCKEPQLSVVFTESLDTPFESFTPEAMQFKDSKLSIFFESQEMMDDSLLLLRFNCPDSSCDYIGNGWGDLRLHVRATHGKLMCDLCVRSKKVFAHEHALYAPNQLAVHLPSMQHRPQRNPPKDIEGGIHPLCEFCRECFFSDDELYAHMREHHEDCFICKRNGIRDQYFQNYDSLEKHFTQAHYTCTQSSCLAQKFVVFNTALDLKAHMMDVHKADMTAKDLRDTRRVEIQFEDTGTGGFNRRGRRDRGDREREREPPPPAVVQPPPRPEGGGSRRVVFGSNLTGEGGSSSNQNSGAPSRRPTPDPPPDADPATAERHSAFIRRLEGFAPNPTNAVPAVKSAIRGYRASETSARDLISTIWNVLDRKLEHTASLVNALVDLFEEDDKKQDLLTSWRAFDVEQRRQFPSLVTPESVGSGYAGVTTGRVLNIKHTSGSRSAHQSSRQVWDRVAQAAASSSSQNARPNFPPLQPGSTPAAVAAPKPAPPPSQRKTPWSASAQGTAPQQPTPTVISSSTPRHKPGKQTPLNLSKDSFPELPTVSGSRHKPPMNGNVSLRNILGNNTGPSTSAWASGPGANTGNTAGADTANAATGQPIAGGGKKGKGKQKQTVYTLGSFRT